MEEIIVDSVDVAGCGYFCEADNECNICGMGTDGEDTFCRLCKDNPNCYYKQLAKLKAENERLKRENEIITGMHNSSSNRFDKLYSTLQEVKAIATRAFAVCDDDCGNANRFTEILDLITKEEEE